MHDIKKNLGSSPYDGRTLIHFNVILRVFHIDHISQGVCKIVRTTFQCIVVLQSQGEGPEKAHNYGTDWGQILRTFSLRFENNDTLKCSSDSFAYTLRYWSMWKTVRTTLMYHCSPIAGKKVLNSIKIGWTQHLRAQHTL